jgi:hypothetical protein
MACPDCGSVLGEFRIATSIETHGLDCGPFERFEQEFILCRRCGGIRQTRGSQQAGAPAPSAPLFRHTSPRSRCRLAHHPAAAWPLRPARNHDLHPSVEAPYVSHGQPTGRALARREVDVPATTGGGRPDPRSRDYVFRGQPEMVHLAAPEDPDRPRLLPHFGARRSHRRVFPLRAARHLI